MNTKRLTDLVYGTKMCFKAHLHKGGVLMEKSLQVLRDAGGVMSFAQFMDTARMNKEPGALWLRLKHAGVLETFFDEAGVLQVRAL